MRAPDLSFERILAPVAPDLFLSDHWQKTHLVVRREDSEYYGSVLSFADVDRCIASAKESQRRDLLSIVPPPNSGRERSQYRVSDVSMHKLYTAFSGGDTIRLSGIQEFWPPAVALAATLGEALSGTVGINLYMTPADSQAFPVHFDLHDVFVLQVDGSKEWFIYEPDYLLPVESLNHVKNLAKTSETRIDESKARLVEKVRIEKGDFLYIPRGIPHKAVATDHPSLHLTLGVHPVYWVDFLRRAIDLVATEHVDLRQALPPGFVSSPEAQAEMPSAFEAAVRLATGKMSFEKTLKSLADAVVKGQRYPPDGHFATLLGLDEIGIDSVVERRQGLECLVDRSGQHSRIRFSSNEVQGPAAIAPVLEYIRDHKRFRVRELPGGLGEKGTLVLVRRLIREGLLRPAVESEEAGMSRGLIGTAALAE